MPFLDIRHRSSGRAPERRWRFGHRRGRWLLVLLALVAALLLISFAACGSLGYGAQALAGGAAILAQREPIERVLRRTDLPVGERRHLEQARAIREYAVVALALPDNRSYRTYVRLGREAVTWNVVAAPRLGLEPLTWCFPVAGCVSYRGYFREERARRFAAKLAARGFDVTLGGVSAYSTLGWFADPVLDTFFDESDWHLAALIFHELAHQVAYAKDDTAFNESFATAVEELGVERWLEAQHDPELVAAAEREQRESRLFRALRTKTHAELAELYASKRPDEAKLEGKKTAFERLTAELAARRASGELGPRFDAWLGHAWNNADLTSLADYTEWVPAFRALFDERGGFPGLYRAARELAELSKEERRSRLEALRSSLAPSS